jgi:hypothetical protein
VTFVIFVVNLRGEQGGHRSMAALAVGARGAGPVRGLVTPRASWRRKR